MFLQGIIENVEEKGYFINLGFKDGSKGFLKFGPSESHMSSEYEKGDLIMVQVKSSTGKIIKTERLSQTTV